jgi:ComF family protein
MKRKQILAAPFSLVPTLFRSILNFVYPPYCIVCNSRFQESNKLICESCWNSFPIINDNYDLSNEIRSKISGPVYFSNAFSIWEFSPAIQNIIHHLKYQNFKILANRIGILMADRLRKLQLPKEKTIIIPVPLHKTRMRERGYNQSALLSNVIATETGLPYNDQILERIRYTQSQTKLTATERLKNVQNAFNISLPKEIENKIIILVDDVITTGATINECAKELMKAGAEAINLFSIAKV